MILAKDILKKYWNYHDFRENQIPIIESILSGKDTFGLLTTGGGKSICFQVPAMMKDGVCIVVSPLIALMKDQVTTLKQKKIPAAAYYASQPKEIQKKILDYAIVGKLKFLYVSPERLVSKEFMQRLRQMKINYLIIDEAHCISQWGYDFRPAYLKITQIYPFIENVPKVALTATATAQVVDDIIEQLEFKTPNIIRSSFFKPNLSYQVYHSETKLEDLVLWLNKMKGSGLVYVNKRAIAEELVKQLKNQFGIDSDFYHAGLSIEQRNAKQEKWINTPNSLMISTNAFGMGIDHPYVNFVIHYNFPDTLEAYFQESGRAGRSGQKSYAISLVSNADIRAKNEIIENYPTVLEVKNILLLLFNYYQIPYDIYVSERFDFIVEDFVDSYKLNSIHTHKCLQILKDNELIQINEAYYKSEELQIIADDRTLQEFMETQPEYAQLLKNMIRTFEGIFYLKKVSIQKLAKNYHYNIYELQSMLRNLRKWEIVHYIEATNKPTIEFFVKKQSIDSISIDSTQYFNRKKIIQNQLHSVIQFIENAQECRSIQLLRYLDEKTNHKCGICDVCIQSKSEKKMRAEDYLSIRDIILASLEKNVYVSVDKLLKVNKLYSPHAVRKVIDRLLELNLIEKGQGETFRLK